MSFISPIFECVRPMCGGQFTTEISLKMHTLKCHRKIHSCVLCDKRFSSVAALRMHTMAVHRSNNKIDFDESIIADHTSASAGSTIFQVSRGISAEDVTTMSASPDMDSICSDDGNVQ